DRAGACGSQASATPNLMSRESSQAACGRGCFALLQPVTHTLQTKLRNSNASAQYAAMLAVHASVHSDRTIRAQHRLIKEARMKMTNSIGSMKIVKNPARPGRDIYHNTLSTNVLIWGVTESNRRPAD